MFSSTDRVMEGLTVLAGPMGKGRLEILEMYVKTNFTRYGLKLALIKGNSHFDQFSSKN